MRLHDLYDEFQSQTVFNLPITALCAGIVQHPLLFGVYSVAVTVLTGAIAGLGGLSSTALIQQGVQTVVAAFNTCLVCMPIILIFGQMRGAYLGGSLLTFFLGYCILFF